MIDSYRTAGPQTQCGTYLIFFTQDGRSDSIAGPCVHVDDVRDLDNRVANLRDSLVSRTGLPVSHVAVNRIDCTHH